MEKLKENFSIEEIENVEQYKIKNYEGLIIAGGEDITSVESQKLKELIFSAFKHKKPVIAMDCGAVVLANQGFLVGKCATVNERFGDYIHKKGAIVFDDSLLVDKNLITTSLKEPNQQLLQVIRKLLTLAH